MKLRFISTLQRLQKCNANTIVSKHSNAFLANTFQINSQHFAVFLGETRSVQFVLPLPTVFVSSMLGCECLKDGVQRKKLLTEHLL